ncbi:hypothetical protein QNL75_26995 [Pseudomonas amygdali pv. morsprunorum]|uniref:hypothetical protein n=1 Tax=Pseudomonas amygdali TaxID=47877 RepID=UPI0028907D13|nr:hypothetical protein [Pseudomonas amygdali]MDT3268706.1 hypothetical protein [Pseudomonas amygdali pv. morsprunorum]
MKYIKQFFVFFCRSVAATVVGMIVTYLLMADPMTATFGEFLTLFQDGAMQQLVGLTGAFIAIVWFGCTSVLNQGRDTLGPRVCGDSASNSELDEPEQKA